MTLEKKCIYPRCLISDGALSYMCVSGRDCDPNELSMSLATEHKRLHLLLGGDGTAYNHDEDDDGPAPNSVWTGLGIAVLISVGMWLVATGIIYLIWFWPR